MLCAATERAGAYRNGTTDLSDRPETRPVPRPSRYAARVTNVSERRRREKPTRGQESLAAVRLRARRVRSRFACVE